MKDFYLNDNGSPVMTRIAVDSKYWLYINGRLAVFEGGLKRGPGPHSIYYDELDIHRFLHHGTNRVAILVWFFGKSGFSHASSGCGGLYFEADLNGVQLFSDSSWKAKRNPAYIPAPEDDTGPNFRLPESDVYYDAEKELGNWYAPAYSVDEWDFADELGPAEQASFGAFVKRDIPFSLDGGIRDFVNSEDVMGITARQDMTAEMRLPYNLQFTPVLHLYSPAGKKIVIRPENYYTNAPGENCIKCVYFTRDGYQEYESLGWMNGEKIRFEIPAGVTVRNLQYRETGYDTQMAGSFVCDDPFLNRLWEKSWRTLYVCMRDTFMDCPNRERAQWWGDVNLQMQMLVYCMDRNAARLYEKGVNTLIGWYESTGIMPTVAPSGIRQFELPFQNLSGIYGFWLYYQYTGSRSFVSRVYPMSRAYVSLFDLDSDGLVIHRRGSWDWPDWGENADLVIMENAWYCLALTACANMADVLEIKTEMAGYRKRVESIRHGIRSRITKDGVFYDHTANGLPDDRANALAVLAGFCDGEKKEGLLRVFKQIENSSPYMEKYVLDALCEMGFVEEAVLRIRKRYGPMVEDDYSTLWELWNKESSLNHGWSGGPLITLSKYVAGIAPSEPEGNAFLIRPHLCGLKKIDCTIPTVLGPLTVEISIEDGNRQMVITHPKGISVSARPPVENTTEEEEAWNIVFRPTGNHPSSEII